jgi:HD-GYP domain-containing protein (c-di-GMP phosphodiesterase class II)
MRAPVDLFEGIDEPTTLIAANRRHQISARDLQDGMFVAELDRPWLDTPFLLQGFLIDSQVELDTLRKYCSYVYVDLEMSLPDVSEMIRQAEIVVPATRGLPARARPAQRSPATKHAEAAAGSGAARAGSPSGNLPTAHAALQRARQPPRIYRVRSDVRISTDTRKRFRQLLKASSGTHIKQPQRRAGMVSRAFGWLRALVAGSSSSRLDAQGSLEAIQALLPPHVKLRKYPPQLRSIEEELPRARSSLARSEEVLRQVGADIKSGRPPDLTVVCGIIDELVESLVDNPDALMWVARLREEDITTYNHGIKVALYMLTLGRHIGLPKAELANLGAIGMLADVGKTKLPRALLEKPGMLSPSEFSLVKKHVRFGLEELEKNGSLPPAVVLGIAQHHERLDGTGYPEGLEGDEISLYGRLAAIADCFAALITPRAYANPSAPQDALMNLFEWAGSSFHEPLVEQFVQAVGVFPVGSMVELSTGEVAVVVAHNRVRRLEPWVLKLTSIDKVPLAKPIECDLLARSESGERHSRIIRGLPSGAFGLKLHDYYARENASADAPAS